MRGFGWTTASINVNTAQNAAMKLIKLKVRKSNTIISLCAKENNRRIQAIKVAYP
jgi:hypothetical protein